MSPRPFRRVFQGGLLALLLAGCGTSGPVPPPVTSGDVALPRGAWVLTIGEDHAGVLRPVDSHPVTLEVGEDAVSGTAGCNGYGGPIDEYPGGPLLGGLSATEMGCSPAAVLTLEQRYLAALARVDDATRQASGLVLTGPSVRLEFEAADGGP